MFRALNQCCEMGIVNGESTEILEKVSDRFSEIEKSQLLDGLARQEITENFEIFQPIISHQRYFTGNITVMSPMQVVGAKNP